MELFLFITNISDGTVPFYNNISRRNCSFYNSYPQKMSKYQVVFW